MRLTAHTSTELSLRAFERLRNTDIPFAIAAMLEQGTSRRSLVVLASQTNPLGCVSQVYNYRSHLRSLFSRYGMDN